MRGSTIVGTVRTLVLLACARAGFAQTTLPISVAPTGTTGNASSSIVKGTPDLRWVVWHSEASDLVTGDTNGVEDVFRRDLWTGTTTRVSLTSSQGEGDGDSRWARVSADGRWIAFQSFATNLVEGDTNGVADVFVRDLVLATTTRVSTGSGAVQADGSSRYPMISRDGRLIVFESTASNLVADDTNARKDVFVHDRQTGTTTRITVGPAGQEADGDSGAPTFSPDGSRAVFVSDATNLVGNDTNGCQDVFVADLASGAIVRASTDAAGNEGNGSSFDPYLSLDGRLVAYRSDATNLVVGDTNGVGDVFVKDLLLGTILRASVDGSGSQAHWASYAPWITPDGRFILFTNEDSSLVPSDTNGVADVFLRDLVSGTIERVTLGFLGQQSNGGSSYPIPSDDARLIAFESVASNLVTGDGNGSRDVFVRDRSSSFQALCPGDGTLATPCPCGNLGSSGNGCENSAFSGGARLAASGTPIPDTVQLASTGELASSLTIFLQGDAASATGTAFGDGVRCASGLLLRLYVKNAVNGAASAPAAGEPSISQRSAALGAPLSTGCLRWYQAYYRDPVADFCPPAAFNTTNALRIAW